MPRPRYDHPSNGCRTDVDQLFLDERIWRANDRAVNISCANRHNFWLLVRLDLIPGNV
jgi:hypothetical protein